MEDIILKLLQKRKNVPANLDQLAPMLSLPEDQQPVLRGCLKRLERTGRITRVKGFRFALAPDADLIAGRIQITRQGRGFFMPDDRNLKELLIPVNATGTALHEDRVLVRPDDLKLLRQQQLQDVQATGAVVRVIERRRTQIVGTFQLQKNKPFHYVTPDDPRISAEIRVPPPSNMGRTAKLGDKVVVELLAWESKAVNPEGKVLEVLGSPTKEGVDMLAILRQYSLPTCFPPEVLEEAEQLSLGAAEVGNLKDRVDCRQHDVITIDPVDAKDFDDAFCLQQHESETWKLWVHIADVSHYVQPDSLLDKEAQKRGNSTYLVDRVIPMFPEVLSNDLCSLKPRVDRLTKCIEFTLRDTGAVIRSQYYPAVIRSKYRFTYKKAMAVLKKKPKDNIGKMLHQASKLAQALRKRRFRAGALDFDFPESKIHLDEAGAVKRIEKVENDLSHQLIEEFMLLTNEAVAWGLMRRQHATALYRVHEPPGEQKLQAYRAEVLSCGIPCGNLKKSKEVRKLFQHLAVLPVGKALKINFLKSLMRARYADSPLGHYGLAKPEYTHFTSPIRRYADLMVHRSLFEMKKVRKLKPIADHISMTERNSADAERDSREIKLFAYLNAQIQSGKPKSYLALVIEIRHFGFFIDVEILGLSGFVPLSILDDDFYLFDCIRHQIIGQTHRRRIRVGDNVKVKAAKVNSLKKQIDFCLVSKRRTKSQKTQAAKKKRGERTAQKKD